jgi:hypothetical protein
MRTLLLMFALVACGSDSKPAIDAAPPPIDTPVAVTPSCATYCTNIQANCTAANAQYPDPAHCMAACAAFPVGLAADTSGNTLGCRVYHSGAPAMMDPATHCVHAGPGGDKTSAAAPGTCGDACTSFCEIEIKACGVTGDAGGFGQYASQTDCVTKCANFNKVNLYGVTSKGDSLACRLYHATNAAITGMQNPHCAHTAETPTGPCAGAASP